MRKRTRAGVAGLLLAGALLAGCYHPHHYAHHRPGGYYDHDGYHDGPRHRRKHHRRHHVHGPYCRY